MAAHAHESLKFAAAHSGASTRKPVNSSIKSTWSLRHILDTRDRSLLEWLMENRSLWGEFAETYRTIVAQFSEKLPANSSRINLGVVHRLAQSAAAIRVAAIFAHAAIDDLPSGLDDPLETIWNETVAATGEAAGEERALRDVVSWAHSRQQTFWGREQTRSQLDRSGRWDKADDWSFIAFYPHVLKKLLADFNTSQTQFWPAGRRRDGLISARVADLISRCALERTTHFDCHLPEGNQSH